MNTVSLPALRLSIASRLHYQFQTGLPKEFLMDIAAERNRVALPGASRGFGDTPTSAAAATATSGAAGRTSTVMAGMRLPPERFCLTGVGWNLRDGWESDGEEEVVVPSRATASDTAAAAAAEAGQGEQHEEEDDEGGDDEDGRMEDVFGEDTVMAEAEDEADGDGEKDKDMTGT